jgi:hypothetical protein
MRDRTLALLVIAWLVWLSFCVGHATAATVVTTPGPWQGYVDAARVPTPPGELTVDVTSEGCGDPELLACARPGLVAMILPLQAPRKTFLHELGHEFDSAILTDADRGRFQALLGRRVPMSWWGADPNREGGEWFADVYMDCAKLPRINPRGWYSISSGLLAGWRLRRECALIWDAA